MLNGFVLPFYNVGIISGKLLAASFLEQAKDFFNNWWYVNYRGPSSWSSAGIIIWFQSCVYMLSWRQNAHAPEQKHMHQKGLKGYANLPTSCFCFGSVSSSFSRAIRFDLQIAEGKKPATRGWKWS